jgi:uncharacterized membrane protein YfcA
MSQGVTVADSAKVAKVPRTLWLFSAVAVAIIGTLLLAVPNNPDLAAGLSTRELVLIDAILFLSATMSGLCGFGFSAVGAATLLFIPPITEAPLLQTLSTGNQLVSAERLRADMPGSWKSFWDGPGYPIVGGMPGAYAGIWMLSHLPARQLMTVFGAFLVMYCIYSLFRPAGARLRGFDGPITGMIVGFIGGAFGGFTAFPGAAVVVWAGLRALPKAQSRAIVQPYIIMSQLFSVGLIVLQHPQYLSGHYWTLLLLTLPAVLPGTFCGVALYRRISDINFRRISFVLLGVSGAAILLQLYAPMFAKLGWDFIVDDLVVFALIGLLAIIERFVGLDNILHYTVEAVVGATTYVQRRWQAKNWILLPYVIFVLLALCTLMTFWTTSQLAFLAPLGIAFLAIFCGEHMAARVSHNEEANEHDA